MPSAAAIRRRVGVRRSAMQAVRSATFSLLGPRVGVASLFLPLKSGGAAAARNLGRSASTTLVLLVRPRQREFDPFRTIESAFGELSQLLAFGSAARGDNDQVDRDHRLSGDLARTGPCLGAIRPQGRQMALGLGQAQSPERRLDDG